MSELRSFDMRKFFASRAFGPIPLLLLLGSSCSLVYDLSPDQCGSNSDCVAHFGEGFTCDSGVCTCREASCSPGTGGSSGKGGTAGTDASGGTDARGGTAGKGGSSGTGTTGGSSGSAGEAGSETGGTSSGNGGSSGSGGKGGKGGTAGTGGGTVEPECTSHSQCLDAYEDSETNPRACIKEACVPLLTEDCPYLLPLLNNDDGNWNILRGSNTIILGGYTPFSGPALGTIGRNYNLALLELQEQAQGVFAGSANRRKVAMVVCNSLYDTQDDLLAASQHLVDDLKVPGMVSALLLQDQQYVWENVLSGKDVLMMNPTYPDQQLLDEPDDGLIWHMLSAADKLSVSYQPLLDMTVQHLKARGSLGEAENLRVVHVKARDEPFLRDTAVYFDDNVQFNGQSVSANLDAGLYHPVAIDSDYVDPSGTSNEAAITAILTNAPHVVIGTTVSELYKRIIPAVEDGWVTANPTQDKPFYLVGAIGYGDSSMAGMISAYSSVSRRMVGLNWPSAVDPTLYNAYQNRYLEQYGAREHGWENFYDATYYLIYGLAAARAPLTGTQIAAGLLRVTARGSGVQQVDVGPSNAMQTAINSLSTGSSKFEVIGAMGPPNWDVYGARNDAASVWCVNNLGTYIPDRFRYDSTDSSLQPSGTPPIGEACFPFPAEPPPE